jgi:hypothetical protein
MKFFAIKVLAIRMRKTIESIPHDKLPLGISKFPFGACGDASILMGKYMTDNGLTGFDYVCGERGNIIDHSWTSHAWLCRDRLVVDITADQFPDAPTAIIVSESSKWHEKFQINHRSPSNLRLCNGYGIGDLYDFYNYLKPQLFKDL